MLPVGGGGLAAGVTHYFADQGREARFVFCEPAGAPSLHDSLAAGKRLKLAKVDNFVDGAAVAEIGREPLRFLKEFAADTVRLIPENRLCATMRSSNQPGEPPSALPRPSKSPALKASSIALNRR